MSTPISLSIPTTLGRVPLSADERGSGRGVVILHGGAGPVSVTGFADLLADATGARVIVPTTPVSRNAPAGRTLDRGWSRRGLRRPARRPRAAGRPRDRQLDRRMDHRGARAPHPARLGRIALVHSVGIEVDGHPVASDLQPAQLAEFAWYDPTKAPRLDLATMPPAVRAIAEGNRATLAVYGTPMTDPTLHQRLADVDVPALVVWGEADRIADPDYGRAFAAAIPGARFELLPGTGHVPQMETPELLLRTLTAFVTE